ncbi:MAG TPA: hypothetical protein PLG34_08765 [Spirochaetota bacterium]|jgi:hypothetical protein|nr:hypothetical protein [Spirochaetota bacterium]
MKKRYYVFGGFMFLFNMVVYPLFFFTITIILQKWLDKGSFSETYKFFGFGIVLGIVLNLVFSIINSFFYLKANVGLILFKAIVFDGLLYTFIMITVFHLIYELFADFSSSAGWSMQSILVFSFYSGIISVSNIFNSTNNNYPETLLSYIPSLFTCLLVSISFGFFYMKFSESFDSVEKYLWAGAALVTLSALRSFYEFTYFYKLSVLYFIAVPAIAIAVIFEILDFSRFRT